MVFVLYLVLATDVLAPVGRAVRAAAAASSSVLVRSAHVRFAEGLADLRSVATLLASATITCPGHLPCRSDASLAHLALGDHEWAERLAEEELEVARVFRAPRSLGVAM